MLHPHALNRLVSQQGGDCRRSHGHVLAAAEDYVQETPEERAVEPVLGRKTGNVGIRERLRYHCQSYCYSGDEIAKAPGSVVFGQPVEDRKPPVEDLLGAGLFELGF